jgi:hypothetical protein
MLRSPLTLMKLGLAVGVACFLAAMFGARAGGATYAYVLGGALLAAVVARAERRRASDREI